MAREMLRGSSLPFTCHFSTKEYIARFTHVHIFLLQSLKDSQDGISSRVQGNNSSLSLNGQTRHDFRISK